MQCYPARWLILVFLTILQMYCANPATPDGHDELSGFEPIILPSEGGFSSILYFDTYSGDQYVDVYWITGIQVGFDDMFGNLDTCIFDVGRVDLLISEEGPSEGFKRIQRTGTIGEDSLRVLNLRNNKLYYFRLLTYCEGDSLIGISEPRMTSPGAQLVEVAQIPANQADPPRYLNVMDWSSDGAEIAYIQATNGSESDIYMFNVQSNESRQITYFSGSHRLMGVDFQPKGSDLLYNYSPSRTAGLIDYRVWHLPAPYNPSAAYPITAGRVDGDGVWLSDLLIIYTKGTYEPPNIPVIHYLSIGESDVGNILIEENGLYQYDPTISDDGAMIAFTGRSSGTSAIYTAHLPGASDVAIAVSNEYRWDNILPRWMPNDNDALLFSSSRSGHFEIWRLEIATATVQQLTRSRRGREVFGGVFDPTGKYLLFHSMLGAVEGVLIISEIQ